MDLGENAEVFHAERLLPICLAEGCRLQRNIARDQVLSYDDVELPTDRLCDKLRLDQDTSFFDRPAAIQGSDGPKRENVAAGLTV